MDDAVAEEQFDPRLGKVVKGIGLLKTSRPLPSSQQSVALLPFTFSFHSWIASAATSGR